MVISGRSFHLTALLFQDLSPRTAYSRRVVVSYKRKYVQDVLVNHSVKLALDKKCGR